MPQVDNTLYNLHISILRPNSIVLGNMFSMPSNSGVFEGRCDDNPIVLHEPFTAKKWEHLVNWFYRQVVMTSNSVLLLISDDALNF